MTKKISLLLMLGAVLFLSSCLDVGSQSIIGNNEPSYITAGSSGVVYARTERGYLITSPKIKTLTTGSVALLSYQITEDSELVTVEDNITAYNADLGGEPVILDQTNLRYENAPDVPAVKFESLLDPFYRSNQWFGDRWIFTYYFKAKKGENVKVNFYKASDEDAKAANCDVLIDVRLEKSGTPEAGAAEKTEAENIVVNLSSLRLSMADKADANGSLNIKFRHYRIESDELYTSPRAFSMAIDKK